jgi:hypothetical protein
MIDIPAIGLQSDIFSFASGEIPESLLNEAKQAHSSRSDILQLVQKLLAQKGANLKIKYPFPRLRYEASFFEAWGPQTEVHVFVRTKDKKNLSQLIVMLINKREEGTKPYKYFPNVSMTFQLGRQGYEEINLNGLKALITEDMVYHVDEVIKEQNAKVRGNFVEENKRRVALVVPRVGASDSAENVSTIEIRMQQLSDRD